MTEVLYNNVRTCEVFYGLKPLNPQNSKCPALNCGFIYMQMKYEVCHTSKSDYILT